MFEARSLDDVGYGSIATTTMAPHLDGTWEAPERRDGVVLQSQPVGIDVEIGCGGAWLMTPPGPVTEIDQAEPWGHRRPA